MANPTRSKQLLDDIATHKRRLGRGVPERVARRVYGAWVVNRLLARGVVRQNTVEIGNGFCYDELETTQ